MARLESGIFSRPSGQTGGLVFGAARTRIGKVVTVRQKVKPSDPKTSGQLSQRSKFKDAQNIVRRLGSDVYQNDWNRSIGQLPGFQSMNSIFLQQMNDSKQLQLTIPINLGILHVPDTIAFTNTVSNQIDVSWSSELGDNGTTNDQFKFILVSTESSDREDPNGVRFVNQSLREDESASFTGLKGGTEYNIYYYFAGDDLATGLLSVANFHIISAGS